MHKDLTVWYGILTHLIYMSTIEGIDKGRVCHKSRVSWPLHFVITISEVETQVKEEFVCPQTVAKVVTWDCCKL